MRGEGCARSSARLSTIMSERTTWARPSGRASHVSPAAQSSLCTESAHAHGQRAAPEAEVEVPGAEEVPAMGGAMAAQSMNYDAVYYNPANLLTRKAAHFGLGINVLGPQLVFDRIQTVDRHDLPAERVGCSVEGNRQTHVEVSDRQPAYSRHVAGSRNSDAAATDGRALRKSEQRDGTGHVSEIQQRLAHAHHHNVGEALIPLGEELADLQELIDDLGRREVADESHPPGSAELAVQGTAHLGGKAGSAAPALDNQDCLNPLTLRQLEEKLDRLAIARLLLRNLAQAGHGCDAGQAFAEPLRQVGHFGQPRHSLAVEPAHELVGPVARFTQLADEPSELIGRESPQVRLPAARPGRSSGIGQFPFHHLGQEESERTALGWQRCPRGRSFFLTKKARRCIIINILWQKRQDVLCRKNGTTPPRLQAAYPICS